MVVPDLDMVAVVENLLLDDLLIDESAVVTAQVLQDPVFALAGDSRVPPGYGEITQNQGVVIGPADRGLIAGKGKIDDISIFFDDLNVGHEAPFPHSPKISKPMGDVQRSMRRTFSHA